MFLHKSQDNECTDNTSIPYENLFPSALQQTNEYAHNFISSQWKTIDHYGKKFIFEFNHTTNSRDKSWYKIIWIQIFVCLLSKWQSLQCSLLLEEENRVAVKFPKTSSLPDLREKTQYETKQKCTLVIKFIFCISDRLEFLGFNSSNIAWGSWFSWRIN